ncbi:hypothetical protein RUND412_000120 [Rhizina undulata]
MSQTKTQSPAERIAAYAVGMVDRYVMDKETRGRVYKGLEEFSRAQPFVASFLALQFLFAFLPLFTLVSFSVGVLLLAVIAAAGFCAFWISIGVSITLAVISITATMAGIIWVWGVSSYILFQWTVGILYSLQARSQVKPKPSTTSAQRKGQSEVAVKKEEEESGNGVYGVQAVDGEFEEKERDEDVEKIKRDIERSLR